MTPLDSPLWKQLKCSRNQYGPGDGERIPPLLRALELEPWPHGNTWVLLWDDLCDGSGEDGVCSAAFAAVPHIIRIAASNPRCAMGNYFELPVCIEIARVRARVLFNRHDTIPSDLRQPYFASLERLTALAVNALTSRAPKALKEDPEKEVEYFLCGALAAIAIGQGAPAIADNILDLSQHREKPWGNNKPWTV